MEPVRSSRETTQPNRHDTIYWATGLTPVFLEGALDRALNPLTKAPAPHVLDPVFSEPAPPVSSVEGPSHESVLNPFSVYRKGESLLRRQLAALSGWHLVNIILAYGLSEQREGGPGGHPGIGPGRADCVGGAGAINGVRFREPHASTGLRAEFSDRPVANRVRGWNFFPDRRVVGEKAGQLGNDELWIARLADEGVSPGLFSRYPIPHHVRRGNHENPDARVRGFALISRVKVHPSTCGIWTSIRMAAGVAAVKRPAMFTGIPGRADVKAPIPKVFSEPFAGIAVIVDDDTEGHMLALQGPLRSERLGQS